MQLWIKNTLHLENPTLYIERFCLHYHYIVGGCEIKICLSPEIMNKSMLPLLMLPFVAVLTLELLLEMVEHALRVA